MSPKPALCAGEPVGALKATPGRFHIAPAIGDCLALSTLHIAGDIGLTAGKSMKQDDKDKGSSRQDRLKRALRENLKRRKSQARGRNDGAAASTAGAKASLDDGNEETSD